MASTTKTTTERIPQHYYEWDADNRFPELKRALANHHANLERLQELCDDLSNAQNHVDDHVYAIRVLDRLNDDFCFGAEAAGKKVNKFMKTYCGVYDADEFVSYELLRSIDALKEVQRKNCRKVVELEDQIKIAEEVKSKGWDTYHALDKKREAEFDKLLKAQKEADAKKSQEEVAV